MEIREIISKEQWESFLARQEDKTFMQSWAWGDFRQEVGEKIWRLGVYENDLLVAVALVSKKVAKRGTYLEIAHGPICAEAKAGKPVLREKILSTLLERLKVTAKNEHASFIRLNPLWARNEENKAVFKRLGFRQAPMHTTYESSWKLDIRSAEEELLSRMRKTTRYLIRQTVKNSDIEVRQSVGKENVEQFYALSLAAGKRQKFTPFAKSDTETEISVFQKDNAVSLFFGLYKGKPVAAALVIFWARIGFYHQAASLGEYAKYSVPYLVQWEAIKEAKRRGCKLYDFWGYVDPKKHPSHPWAGPTLFKMGFGGKVYEYVKTQDYPLSLKYWPTAIFETIRAKRRGL